MTVTAPFQLDALLGLVYQEDTAYLAHRDNLVLHSHFQPIFSFAHRRVVGHEGLLRAWSDNGRQLSPYTVFASARSEPELVTLDRLARLLHSLNFSRLSTQQQSGMQWLFLNAEPNAFAHAGQYGRFFPEMLEKVGIAPTQVVIEVLETAIENNRQLARAVDYFREMGCLIAIDDFGAGHSNVDRIWRLRPDIVKLDRTLIADAADNPEARHILPGLVTLLHEAGSLVLAEGIENDWEAFLAMEADCDLVQGYYFATPSPNLFEPEALRHTFEQLWRNFETTMHREINQNQQLLAPYTKALLHGADRLVEGGAFEQATAEFLTQRLSLRCFLLDAVGCQVDDCLSETHLGHHPSADRFAPLADTKGAIWSRRQYFRQAMRRFGELQISRPYLALTDGQLCVTLSLGIRINNQPFVLCGDLAWYADSELLDGAGQG
ncbi:sensor domain-containing phosphodiesterase [Chitinimonas lacunae]|uniref:EAL domain-containing protein n=1 Tax=Chitinimonas lacunae TaxID=1963018 RepID=A0ABV8MLS6_9NEIS